MVNIEAILNAESEEGDTVLHVAIRNNRFELAKMILEMRPDLMGVRNARGDLPVHLACEEDRMVALFFSGGRGEVTRGMMGERDGGGMTPLELSARYRTRMGMLAFSRNGGVVRRGVYRERIARCRRTYWALRRVRDGQVVGVSEGGIRRVARKLF